MNRIGLISLILLAACSPTPSQSLGQPAACASAGTPAPFATPTNPTELMNSSLVFLSQGGRLEALEQRLSEFQSFGSDPTIELREFNLIGTSFPAVVIAAIFRGDTTQPDWLPPDSGVIILYCEGESYQGEITTVSPLYQSLEIAEIIDLKEDGRQEVVISIGWMVAGSVCALGISIFGWEQGQVIDYFGGGGPDVDCRVPLKFYAEPSGETELIVQGNTHYTAFGGPGRDVRYHYQFNGDRFVPASTEYLSAPYRIHALEDAQIALQAGEIKRAIELYYQAARDDKLLDTKEFLLLDEKGGTRNDYQANYLKAFAYFRLIGIQFWQDRSAEAPSLIQEFETHYPPSAHGSELVEALRIFEAGLKEGQSVTLACGAVTDFIEQNHPALEQYFYAGYNNLIILNEDICAFPGEKLT